MGYVNSTKVIFGDISNGKSPSDVLSERNKMTDSVEISFVNENYFFVKEGKWYFLSENSQWENNYIRTSGETYFSFRLEVNNNLSAIDKSQSTP